MERYRILSEVGVYYLTFTVVEWLPVFIDEIPCNIITDSLNYCITNKHLAVNASLGAGLPTPPRTDRQVLQSSDSHLQDDCHFLYNLLLSCAGKVKSNS